MSYQVLARKWRPQRFDDVVGQQAVTRTLRNALTSGRHEDDRAWRPDHPLLAIKPVGGRITGTSAPDAVAAAGREGFK